ncbi:hypothetical protein HDV00_000135 [Rhizophlyctis rosea]|nr:hypothetical protein HDV00_000135 [Rhizophlyctis rosea]
MPAVDGSDGGYNDHSYVDHNHDNCCWWVFQFFTGAFDLGVLHIVSFTFPNFIIILIFVSIHIFIRISLPDSILLFNFGPIFLADSVPHPNCIHCILIVFFFLRIWWICPCTQHLIIGVLCVRHHICYYTIHYHHICYYIIHHYHTCHYTNNHYHSGRLFQSVAQAIDIGDVHHEHDHLIVMVR